MIVPEKISTAPVIWQLRKITLYGLFTLKGVWDFKKPSLLGTSLVKLPIWWAHKQRNGNPLNYDRPWITFSAKDFLDTILNVNSSVFEYGSGSSTLYFARRVSQVYSIENDKEWFNHLSDYLKNQQIVNVKSQLVEGISANAANPIYNSMAFSGNSFESYVKAIDTFADNSFDVVVVDGRARRGCIAHAAQKVKQGGYLMVDNAERKAYFEGNQFLFNTNEWRVFSFIGPVPYAFFYSKTSFFQKL